MIAVELKNHAVLLFHEWERITTVGWISDDGEYWSGEWRCRADELERLLKQDPRYVIERITETGEAIVEKDWLSPVVRVRKFVPTKEFV